VVAAGRERDAATLPALVAERDGAPVGLLTYEPGPAGLEIVTIDAPERGHGTGTALLDAARRVAAAAGLARV
jgi:GNAT superfamily N-acetyltransferase